MKPEISVHDNFVYAYVVDCERRRIVLHTAFRDREPHELTDIVFPDVLAHRFEDVLPANILFDVGEVDVESFVREHAGLFETSWRYAWPPIEYGGDLDALTAALRAQAVRVYSIGSSYGLSGWVLAGGCERISRSEPATVATE